MTSSGVVNVDRARVAYRVTGNGPAVVLLNGPGLVDTHWGSLIEKLNNHRTVITLDYSGSGDTIDDGRALTLKTLARQVLGVAEASGAETFDLIGYSLGAIIAVFIAAEYPERLRSAILLAGFTWGGEPRFKFQVELLLDLIRTNQMAMVRVLILNGFSPAFLSSMGSPNMEGMTQAMAAGLNWEGLARQFKLKLSVDIRTQAQHITRPVLVVVAKQDSITFPQTRELAEIIPGAICKEINAGHSVLFEQADEFAAIATEFLLQNNS